MTPHKCPACDGKGSRPVLGMSEMYGQKCHACDGEGIVWEPDPDGEPFSLLQYATMLATVPMAWLGRALGEPFYRQAPYGDYWQTTTAEHPEGVNAP